MPAWLLRFLRWLKGEIARAFGLLIAAGVMYYAGVVKGAAMSIWTKAPMLWGTWEAAFGMSVAVAIGWAVQTAWLRFLSRERHVRWLWNSALWDVTEVPRDREIRIEVGPICAEHGRAYLTRRADLGGGLVYTCQSCEGPVANPTWTWDYASKDMTAQYAVGKRWRWKGN